MLLLAILDCITMKLNRKQRIVGFILFLITLPFTIPFYLLIYVCDSLSVIFEKISLALQDFDIFTLTKIFVNIIERFK
jgi:hypothetical protein